VATRTKREMSKIQKRRLEIRETIWPGIDEERLWTRHTKDGYFTVPRTIPLIIQIMNYLSSGKPPGSAYLDLWSRLYDDCFLVLNNHKELAFSSGFTGQRAVRTWAERIWILSEQGFLDVKAGPYGDVSYALLWNPHEVSVNLYKKPGYRDDLYFALINRASEIGAADLQDFVRAKQREELESF
jgi:hypothetical protein